MKLPLAIITLLMSGCSLTIGAGGSYYHNVPTSLMTGHSQFVFSVEGSIPINENWSIDTAYRHGSNGEGLGIGSGINRGVDVVESQLKYRFYFIRPPYHLFR